MKNLFVLIVIAIFSVTVAQGNNLQPVRPWGMLLDDVASNQSLESVRNAFVQNARISASREIIRRAYRLEDIGKHRTVLDGRSNLLEDEIRETFAFAMSDFSACRMLSTELPVLAAAYRLTGEDSFRDRIVAQFEEMATWSPLQRPGWTLYAPGLRLPADGKDGNWLATGCGIRAIGNTFALLPDGTLNSELRDRINALLESEIASIVDDWKTKRSWFIRGNNAITNQWVLPTEGLVRACLILGIEKHREAYELGVKNLLQALDAHGAQGEFEEGFGYGSFTVTSMLHAAHAMAVAGDRRGIDHLFLNHFPTWLVHHFQPGNMIINCFDAGRAYGAAERARPILSLFAACTGSPVARWALAEQTNGPSDDLPGLAAAAVPPVGDDAVPVLYAQYERATRVNWRSSWQDNATGVWVRGGHPLDQHDHQDRGHVNFILGGRPILIEAGTPSYNHPLIKTHYSSGVGHNTLQIGTRLPDELGKTSGVVQLRGWQKPHGVAPITVQKLEEEGGAVVVDGTGCYDGLSRWHRTVTWNVNELTVVDDVALAEDAKDVFLFRWHLGTEEEMIITSNGDKKVVAWPDAKISFEGSKPFVVTSHKLPDNTLAGHDGSENDSNYHTCLCLQSKRPCNDFSLTTRVVPR